MPVRTLDRATIDAMNTLATVLMTIGGLLCFANWWSVISSCITRRFHSAVPLVGAALLGVGMFMNSATRPYAWSALILDYGTLAFLFASPRLIHEVWSTSRFNLLCEYLGEADIKTVRLCFFRHGIFTIRLHLRRPPGECGLVSTGTIGTWKRDGERLTLRTASETAVFDLIQDSPAETFRQSTGFTSWENNHEQSLAGIDFVQIQKRTA
jgi:hypothetical protein